MKKENLTFWVRHERFRSSNDAPESQISEIRNQIEMSVSAWFPKSVSTNSPMCRTALIRSALESLEVDASNVVQSEQIRLSWKDIGASKVQMAISLRCSDYSSWQGPQTLAVRNLMDFLCGWCCGKIHNNVWGSHLGDWFPARNFSYSSSEKSLFDWKMHHSELIWAGIRLYLVPVMCIFFSKPIMKIVVVENL